MAVTERVIKDRVKRVLKKMGSDLDFFMPVQSGYGKRDLDFICSYRGKSFRIETKAPGKLLRATQEVRIDELREAGVDVWVIDDGTNYASEKDLERWLMDFEVATVSFLGKLYVNPLER